MNKIHDVVVIELCDWAILFYDDIYQNDDYNIDMYDLSYLEGPFFFNIENWEGNKFDEWFSENGGLHAYGSEEIRLSEIKKKFGIK